ncbi:trypsin-like peptidase domain-containing protein [Streptomyces fructofermentans]|uniref:trypsin-like peptidase domain-containing protein n=1 Tax=Streptomyces fructofermentans TaxID=152141 RepID=UPI0033F787B1
MDEGKPTRPKWWSRPRTHVPDSARAEAVAVTDGASGVHGGGTDGDFELEKPAGARAANGPSAADPSAGGSGSAPIPAPAPERLAAPAPGPDPAAVPALGTVPVRDDVAAGAGTGGERPRPLHDPDPYSTPPYGRPGPWAPAPPVQHPGTTPAHGTAVGAAAPHRDLTTGAGPEPAAPHGVPGPALPPGQHRSDAPGPGGPGHGFLPPAGPPGEGDFPFPAPARASAPEPGAAPFPAGPEHGGTGPAAHSPWQNYDPWAAAPLQHNGAAAESVAARRGRTRRALVLGAALLALASGGVGGAVGAYLERNGGIDDVELPQADTEAEGRAPDSVAGIAASALPSVVTLHVSGSDAQGTGTGFVLDRRGHILTNNHVVDPADGSGGITVTFSGGQTAKAEVVGHDSGYDLAVVKVKGVSGLKPLPLGNSDNVQVGDPVVAIGAPFDLENTVTAGIISAKERPITAGGEEGDGSDISYVDALQTDAPINPGNSGGPLVDSKARVIGINSAIRSADSGSAPENGQSGSIGLGFAIPINQGKRVAEELINTGKATHPVIGVTLDMEYTGDGARVGAEAADGGPPVTRGGPGDRAGIEAGDVITEVDGQRVRSGEELIVKTRAHRPGDRLELTLERDGRERTVALVLGSADGD